MVNISFGNRGGDIIKTVATVSAPIIAQTAGASGVATALSAVGTAAGAIAGAAGAVAASPITVPFIVAAAIFLMNESDKKDTKPKP